MTLREQYVQALIALMEAQPSFPAQVERSVIKAFTRDESRVVVVHRGGEVPDASKYPVTDRQAEILISVVVRDDAPDQASDEVLEVVHPLVMGFTAPKLIDITEIKTDPPLYADSDRKACMITVRYAFRYRTNPDSLSA